MSTDPRRLPGDIAGPGGAHEIGGVVLDTRHAVLLDHQTVSTVELQRQGKPTDNAVALLLEGRINQTRERARVLFITNEDGAAALVSEMIALAMRAEATGLLPGFKARLRERLDELGEVGNI